ncbi:RNA polymerase sigma-70 factor [Pedobacter cryoconitis]|uniref:RNA polymerase sigma-70 factor (ECF subfamily) n=1 Tax=Pedobacter cryoconitis TaxID=188932 RepID=A0A327T377_9SPHI|nr:RNA polymerase sigma-70 factor [Pedobacter cryoconitis]RAJ35729.1 RNA polymerase sigma-70 factor (ECF subfamily) [Pedobacter cryoconitis]
MEGEESAALSIIEFEGLFRKNHKFLCMVAMNYVHDPYIAEDVVQDFFISYWQRRDIVQLNTSFEAYARRAVKYKSIDYLRKTAITEKLNIKLTIIEEQAVLHQQEDQELQHQRYIKIMEMIQSLPQDRRNIFILHAMEKLSYMQIAEKQNISINTVKTQLQRAYTALRSKTLGLLMGIL